jgi:hypothetical protein
VAEHPRQRDLGHADAASGGDFLDGVDDGSSRGESKDLTTSSTVERWDCSPRGAPGSAGRFGEIAPVSVSRSDVHLTYMINITLTTEFVLPPRGAW